MPIEPEAKDLKISIQVTSHGQHLHKEKISNISVKTKSDATFTGSIQKKRRYSLTKDNNNLSLTNSHFLNDHKDNISSFQEKLPLKVRNSSEPSFDRNISPNFNAEELLKDSGINDGQNIFQPEKNLFKTSNSDQNLMIAISGNSNSSITDLSQLEILAKPVFAFNSLNQTLSKFPQISSKFPEVSGINLNLTVKQAKVSTYSTHIPIKLNSNLEENLTFKMTDNSISTLSSLSQLEILAKPDTATSLNSLSNELPEEKNLSSKQVSSYSTHIPIKLFPKNRVCNLLKLKQPKQKAVQSIDLSIKKIDKSSNIIPNNRKELDKLFNGLIIYIIKDKRHGYIEVQEKHIFSLNNQRWIDSLLIEAYLSINEIGTVFIMPTEYCTNIIYKKGFNDIVRFRRTDFLIYDKIIGALIKNGNHFCCMIVKTNDNFVNGTFTFIDPLEKCRDYIMEDEISAFENWKYNIFSFNVLSCKALLKLIRVLNKKKIFFN